MVDLLAMLIPAAASAFAGYWHGRRVEQEYWTGWLKLGGTVTVLHAPTLLQEPQDTKREG